MGEIEEQEFRWIVEQSEEQTRTRTRTRMRSCRTPPDTATAIAIAEYSSKSDQPKTKTWWAWMVVYTLFVLIGQSSATLLGRLYYNDGGNTILLAALLETIGFPILIPFALFLSSRDRSRKDRPLTNDQANGLVVAAVYIFLGLSQAGSSVLYAIGLQNLPVSTFSLINTTQLGFNAFFSFFLNAQKITPPILNSLVLLTISSTLLIFQNGAKSPPGNPKRKHFVMGFSCTLIASALYSLTLSTTQLTFNKVLKRETFSTVLNMIVCQELVATCIVTVPLFITGEWRVLRNEMENFELGKGVYVTVVVMIAVAWQVCSIGAVGLIFQVSSLFSNVISTVGLPIVPILAAVFFHEKLDGIKVISIVLAVWGFASYVYQHYLNESKSINTGERSLNVVEESCIAKNFISHESQYD